jgi:hypothetical protein
VQALRLRPDTPGTPGLDLLITGSSAHSHDNTAGHDCVWQIVQTRQCNSAIRGQLLGKHFLASDYTAAGRSALPMTGIEHAADVLVVLGLWPEDCVYLVVQDGWGPGRIRHLAKQVGGAGVH